MARVEFNTVKLKRSNVPGKVPTDPSTVDYGELLVNYAEGEEFIATKNSNGEFVKIVAHPDASGVTFTGEHSDDGFTGTTVETSIKQIETEILNNERTASASLNDLNDRLNNLSLGDKNVIEGVQRNGEDIAPDSSKKVNIIVPTDAGDISFSGTHNISSLSGNTVESSITDLEKVVLDNEKVTAASLNDLNIRLEEVPKDGEANKIETISVNGDVLEVDTNKNVEVSMTAAGTTFDSTKHVSGFSGDTVESATINIENVINALDLGDKNVIEKIQLNGNDIAITDKTVDINPGATDVSFIESAHVDTGFTGDNVQTVLVGIENAILDNERVTASALNDLNDRIGEIPEATVTGVTSDDKVLTLTSKLVSATVSLGYGDAVSESLTGKKAIKLLGKNDSLISEIDASEFIKDGMIDSVSFDSTTHVATFTFNASSGKDPLTMDLSSLVDTYSAGEGLTLGEDKAFKVDTGKIATVESVNEIKDYTVNAKKISENPVLGAADIAVSAHSDTGFTGDTVETSIQQIESVILDNERVTAGSLADLDDRINNLSLGDKNVIESIKVNGTVQTIGTDKSVDITVPTTAAEISFGGGHTLTGLTGTTVQSSMLEIESVISDNELVTASALTELNSKINTKVDAVTGKSLSTNDYTTEEKEKLSLIEDGAEANVITSVKVNGNALAITDKAVNVTVPTTVASMTDSSSYAKVKTVEKVLPDNIGLATSGGTAQTVTLDDEKFFIVGNCAGLTINLPDAASGDCQEYCCQFYVPADTFTLTMPSSIIWQNGEVPTFEGNTCCQLVVVNNCATIGTYKATS